MRVLLPNCTVLYRRGVLAVQLAICSYCSPQQTDWGALKRLRLHGSTRVMLIIGMLCGPAHQQKDTKQCSPGVSPVKEKSAAFTIVLVSSSALSRAVSKKAAAMSRTKAIVQHVMHHVHMHQAACHAHAFQSAQTAKASDKPLSQQ